MPIEYDEKGNPIAVEYDEKGNEVPVGPAAAPSMLERMGSALTSTGKAVSDAAGGFVKEAPLVALRAAMMPQDITRGIVDKGAEMMGAPTAAREALNTDPIRQGIQGALGQQPGASTAEQLGRGAARVAPSVALAAATGGTSIPVQAGLQAGLGAAQSEAGTPGGVALDAALSGGSALAGAGANWVLGKAGKLAVHEYAKALDATGLTNKAISKRIVPELVEKGVTGSLPKLAQVGEANSSLAGQALDAAYQQAEKRGTTVNASRIADGLEAMKKAYLGPTGPAGDPIILHQGAIDAINSIQGTLQEFGDKASPAQLWKYRQVLDDVVASSNGFTRPLSPMTAKAISRSARSAIQDQLTKAVPDVKALNADYSLWEGLQQVAAATVLRKEGQSGIVGTALRAGVAHTAAGLAGVTAGAPALAAAGVPYIYTRPAVRTAAAVALNRVAPAAGQVARITAPAAGMSIADLMNQSQER